jgi:ribosomal protein S6--L-glutamate ligase
LEPDDKLLCFGKMEYMRDMVPKKTRRRRSPEVKELMTEEAASPKPEDSEY